MLNSQIKLKIYADPGNELGTFLRECLILAIKENRDATAYHNAKEYAVSVKTAVDAVFATGKPVEETPLGPPKTDGT